MNMSKETYYELQSLISDLEDSAVLIFENVASEDDDNCLCSVYATSDYKITQKIYDDDGFQCFVDCGLGNFALIGSPGDSNVTISFMALYGCEYSPKDFISYLKVLSDV